MPRVSIVIPTYNRARDLRRALASVAVQTISDFEVLVMDDGSQDDSRAVVEAFDDQRFKYSWEEPSGGPAHPRNRGIAQSIGEYIAFLDSDDWWKPNKLEESLKALERGADVVYHDLVRTGRFRFLPFQRTVPTRQLPDDAFHDLLANGNALNTSSVVVRRSLISQIGGFDEARDLVAIEDYDAWLRLAQVTRRFRRIDTALGYYWEGGGNITNPARTLRNLDTLERRYARDLAEVRRSHGLFWMAYMKARAHYLLGNVVLARSFLADLPWRKMPLSINLKKIWMLARMLPLARKR